MNRNIALTVIILVFLVSLVAGMQVVKVAEASVADSSNVDWWPMFHHDLGHTGYSTSTGPATNQTLWTFTTGGAVTTSPAVVDGKVYFGSDDGSIYAVNASSGALIWNYSTGGPVQSSPAVVEGVVYVGGFHSHAVFALNASSGELLWSSPISSVYPNEISSTAVANGLVYVDVYMAGTDGGVLYALNATTGALAWSWKPFIYLDSSPAVDGGKVYVCTGMETVEALDEDSGASVWCVRIRDTGWNASSGGYFPLHCAPCVDKGILYVGDSNQTVYAMNASNGAFLWSGKVVGGVDRSSAAVADGMVYIGTTVGGTSGNLSYGGVCALNATTGVLAWNFTGSSVSSSSPAVAGGIVYVGFDDGWNQLNVTGGHDVCALNGTTGEVIWSYETGAAVYSSPAIANEIVYVGSNDGKVYAFGSPQASQPPQTPTPSVPEFPSCLFIVLLMSIVLSVTISYRKLGRQSHKSNATKSLLSGLESQLSRLKSPFIWESS